MCRFEVLSLELKPLEVFTVFLKDRDSHPTAAATEYTEDPHWLTIKKGDETIARYKTSELQGWSCVLSTRQP